MLIGAFLLFAALAATGQRAGIPWILNIERADSLPSAWNYAKWLVAAVALAAAFRATRQPVHLALGIVFAAILMDDAFELHERINAWAVDRFAIADRSTIRAGDLAGLVTYAVLGLGAVLVLALGYLRSDAAARHEARVIAVLFAALGVFGIAVDTIHGVFALVVPGGAYAPLTFGSGVVEDGGEMLIGSVLAAFAVQVRARARAGG